MKRFLLFLTVLFLLCGQASATTVTFQQNVSSYTGCTDATITIASTNEHITDGTTNTRAVSDSSYLYIIGFNLTSIPTNATVSSATLQLYMDEQNCTSETVGIKQLTDPDSTGLFPSNTSSADVFNTYGTYRYKNETGTVKWKAAGPSNNISDVTGNANESTVASGACPGAPGTAKTLTVTNMVQSWVTTPSTNAGALVSLADTGKVKIASSRVATSSQRPLLTVTYTVPSSRRRVLVSE